MTERSRRRGEQAESAGGGSRGKQPDSAPTDRVGCSGAGRSCMHPLVAATSELASSASGASCTTGGYSLALC